VPGTDSQASAYRSRNSTADRALDILLMFDDDVTVLSANRVAEHLNVARSTAYRYLQSLTSTGFLEENEGGSGFRLGPRILDLARLARKGIGLSDLARPIMRELVRETGFPALLTRRAGASVVCLEREEAGQTLRLSYERGQVLPINAGAAALALLAWAPAEVVEEVLRQPLARFTDATNTDPERLRDRLPQIRDQGYVISRGELDPDVLGVAAPVFGADRGLVAAVSIAALSHRVTDAQAVELAEVVMRAARELGAQVARLEVATI
jgi:DNA-binding IclR family transcriptional regulator